MRMFKVTGQDGQEDYVLADSALMATATGIVTYGPGVAVRPAYYGEWECGLRCGYDQDGRHFYLTPDGVPDYGPKGK